MTGKIIDGLNTSNVVCKIFTYFYSSSNLIAGIALFILFLLILFLIYFIATLQVERKLNVMKWKADVQMIKQGITQDLHDELGSGLTRISSLATNIRSELPANSKNLSDKLERIILQSNQNLEHLRDLIWAENSEHDDLNSMLGYIRNYINDIQQYSKICYYLDIPENLKTIMIHPKIRKNLNLCVKEAVNNALKHSGASDISISFKQNGHSYEFSIKDNGTGFDQTSQKTFSNGLMNFKSRMDQIQGQVFITSELGKGTEIIFKGPLYSS